MRKIIAIVLLITAIVVLFTACKDDKVDETTQSTLSTSDITSTSESTTTTAPSTTGATYVLTTNQSKQAPWYTTTRFVPASVAVTSALQSEQSTTVSNAYENITYPTSDATMPSVSAVTSAARTTEWSTIATTNKKSTTKKTTAKEDATEESTSAVEAEGMQVVVNDSGFNGDGNLYAAIDSQGWGKIKSNSMRIPVYIDGVEADKPGTLQISSYTDGNGNQHVYMDVSAYGGEELGAEISFTVPEGFLKNSSGTKYNYAFVVSSNGY